MSDTEYKLNPPGAITSTFFCRGCMQPRPIAGRRARYTAAGVRNGWRCAACDTARKAPVND